jgi:hypothetical protein
MYSWGWTQKTSETCRVILQLLINILPSCITLVLYIYWHDARKLKHKINRIYIIAFCLPGWVKELAVPLYEGGYNMLFRSYKHIPPKPGHQYTSVHLAISQKTGMLILDGTVQKITSFWYHETEVILTDRVDSFKKFQWGIIKRTDFFPPICLCKRGTFRLQFIYIKVWHPSIWWKVFVTPCSVMISRQLVEQVPVTKRWNTPISWKGWNRAGTRERVNKFFLMARQPLVGQDLIIIEV